MEENLTSTLNIPNKHLYQDKQDYYKESTRQAVRHQNIIGWDKFLRGYTSTYWMDSRHSFHPQTNKKNWGNSITQIAIDLHKAIWSDRNTFVHGKDETERIQKARLAIEERIRCLYSNPPKLASRYHPITQISLHDRLRRSNTYLKQWLSRIEHQIQVSHFLSSTRPPGQLTIRQAFANAERIRASSHKYPP